MDFDEAKNLEKTRNSIIDPRFWAQIALYEDPGDHSYGTLLLAAIGLLFISFGVMLGITAILVGLLVMSTETTLAEFISLASEEFASQSVESPASRLISSAAMLSTYIPWTLGMIVLWKLIRKAEREVGRI